MGQSPTTLFPTLTRTRCDCCDGHFVDEVAAMLIWEAAEAYGREIRAKPAREEAAMAEAHLATAQALAAAKASRGA